jgi:type IV secretory pathway VirB2 component (pilin)
LIADTLERIFHMRKRMRLRQVGRLRLPSLLLLGAAGLLLARPALADSPWENAVNALQISFTGPIARGLSLVAIVVGGLMFAFGEGDSKRMLAGILFGIGMAIGAVNFMAWLFP